MKFRKKNTMSLRASFMISFVLFLLSSFFSVWLIDKRIEPSIMNIAETKTHDIAIQAINEAVSEEMTTTLDIKELIIFQETSEGTAYSFNPIVYNKLDNEASSRVQEFLNNGYKAKEAEAANVKLEDDIIYYMPLGMTTENLLLSTLGPRIPIQFETIGNVTTTIKTTLEESGINNTYLEIFLEVDVEMKVIIPSMSKTMEVKNLIKLGDLFLKGDVPEYYGDVPAIASGEDEE
ncbi:sporulation protein YunB [Jeotgalibacillus proteolyticus]|uniref:sporulation protein YunB n=1 Tax=Jeotgalibacillus proteolyticus TaxID=2082395 RepID=UPI003CEAA807